MSPYLAETELLKSLHYLKTKHMTQMGQNSSYFTKKAALKSEVLILNNHPLKDGWVREFDD